MKHIKSHTELDNDEIVQYVRSILIELDDLDIVTYEIIFFSHKGAAVYNSTNNYGTFASRRKDIDKSLPIDRVDILLNMKGRNRFDYSQVSDVINHINSYLWERGFGQDPKASHYTKLDVSKAPIHNCLLIDFDGVYNLERLCVSFRKKLV